MAAITTYHALGPFHTVAVVAGTSTDFEAGSHRCADRKTGYCFASWAEYCSLHSRWKNTGLHKPSAAAAATDAVEALQPSAAALAAATFVSNVTVALRNRPTCWYC